MSNQQKTGIFYSDTSTEQFRIFLHQNWEPVEITQKINSGIAYWMETLDGLDAFKLWADSMEQYMKMIRDAPKKTYDKKMVEVAMEMKDVSTISPASYGLHFLSAVNGEDLERGEYFVKNMMKDKNIHYLISKCYIPLKQTYGTPMVEAATIKKQDIKYWKKKLNAEHESGKCKTSKNILEQPIAGKKYGKQSLARQLILGQNSTQHMQSVQAMHSKNGFQKSMEKSRITALEEYQVQSKAIKKELNNATKKKKNKEIGGKKSNESENEKKQKKTRDTNGKKAKNAGSGSGTKANKTGQTKATL